jgi:nitrogen fixation/metabolism regulation signal transduction histidine kinase
LAVEPVVTTKVRHCGLGLATVGRVLSAHGGGLRLEPADPTGTVARVRLPAITPGGSAR